MTSDPRNSDKALLRTQLVSARAKRAAGLTADDRAADAVQVASAALGVPLIASAVEADKTIASYLPLSSEPDTTALHTALLQQGIRVLVPECVTGTAGEPTLAWIELDAVNSIELQRDERGIPIPKGQRVGIGAQGLVDANCQVILVPALAVTSDGQRLGKGAGYYDRLFAELAKLGSQDTKLNSIAIVFAGELLDSVPTEPHDAPVTAVLAV
ncbi:MAG: 5-formyltetrahydrofolate cyclo-ligase [Candidatus Nanopelagicales bacterium]